MEAVLRPDRFERPTERLARVAGLEATLLAKPDFGSGASTRSHHTRVERFGSYRFVDDGSVNRQTSFRKRARMTAGGKQRMLRDLTPD